jgi:phosphoglycolate phosphatase
MILKMLDGIRHVIWDWNGTLFDDVDAALRSINTMLGERGLPLLSKERYRQVFGFPVIDCYRVLGFEFNTDSEWDAIANEFHAHYNQIAEESALSVGAQDVLDGLTERGVAMSVLSASETITLQGLLKRYGLDTCFEHVFGLDNLYGSSKLDLGHRLMEQLDVAPDEVLLIGDTKHDFDVAVAMGCRCVLYLDGHQDQARLEGCGCRLVSSFSEFLGDT